MSKGFCYKTFETYDVPRNQLKSFCKYGSKAGYYNISNTRGVCNGGQCRTLENYQPTPWQQPALPEHIQHSIVCVHMHLSTHY